MSRTHPPIFPPRFSRLPTLTTTTITTHRSRSLSFLSTSQKSFAKLGLQSIQDLYDSVCRLYEDGKETDADVASVLLIPARVYLVAQLMTGLDKLVASGKIAKFHHQSRVGGSLVSMHALSSMVGASGVKESSPVPQPHAGAAGVGLGGVVVAKSAAAALSKQEPLRPKGPKTWDQIQADAANAKTRKGTSAACAIL